MKGIASRRAFALALASFALAFAPSLASAGDPSNVSLDGERLTVIARAERASAVITEVERVTGVRIQLPDEAAARSLTVDIRDASVEEAVRAVMQRLAVINLAVIYGGDSMRFIAFPTPAAAAPAGPGPFEEDETEAPEGEAYDDVETAGAEPTDDPVVLAAVPD